MKYLIWLLGVIVSIVFVAYILVFTSIGNSMVKPILESKIRVQTQLDTRVEKFQLNTDNFEIVLELNKNNTITAKGTYSLFSQSFDLTYNVRLEELNTLETLTQTQLKGSFHTHGKVVGDMNLINIDGESDIAKSDTKYHVILTQFNPSSIIAKVDAADLSDLLYMLNQKEYAKAKINLDINFKNITPHQLDGNIVLATIDGALNSKVMKNDFNITIPKTAFAMNLDARLKGDDVSYTYLLNSNLAKLKSKGLIIPDPLKLKLNYSVNVKELAVLKPLTGADVRGALRLEGKVQGSKEKLDITGTTDIASSDSSFAVVLKNFTPKSVVAKVRGLKLEDALYMVKQPHFADALFDMDVAISNAAMPALAGTVKTKVYKGLVDSKYITKAYEFNSTMPKTTFSAVTLTTLNKNIVDTKLNFISTLANLDVNKARFNIKDASLKSDYKVKVHNLDKLYFVTNRHLKGSIVANGELSKTKDLDFTAHSNVAGGKLDAKLHNDDFHADLNSLQTLKILDMLMYPKIFKAELDADLDYNLEKSKGKFTGFLKHGTFTKNQVLDAAKKYAQTDLYIEKFDGDINADIEKENIMASLDLHSNKSSIKTKNTKINTLKKQINSTIDINANGNPLRVKLKGNIDSPKVIIDANKLIQREAIKLLKKQNTKGLEKEAQKLLKSFF
ncbi:hypothetical protein [Sulfurimonas sp.]|uniref:hypothetical protein n=1 Tax=Sulfurimonas sp. TaxID=2022749 RepID=UPI00262E601C|nr:hypothetical protein [Sulfurimonas sp.]